MRRSRRNLIIGLSIAAITSLFCVGAFLFVSLQFGLGFLALSGNDTCDPKNIANTEDLGQFKFPPSMRNLSSWCFGMQGWGGTAQFEMSPADLDYFVSHLQIRLPLARSGIPVDNELATKASTLKSFLHGSYRTMYKNGKSFTQDVLIDTSNPAQYHVYVDFGGG